PREQRGTAMGIFNLGPPIGSALGVAFGASLAAAYDWRVPFYVVGAIGVLTAVIVYIIVPEPARGRFDPAPVSAITPERGASLGQAIRGFFGNRILAVAALASGAANFITYGLSNFATLFLMREKGMALE